MYWRLSNLYFWFFALIGALVPYWSLYLEGQGFTYFQIAMLMATIQFTKIIAPNVWGWLGDHTGSRVRLVRIGALGAGMIFAGVFAHPDFAGLMLVMLGFTFFWNAILPLYETITLTRLQSDRARYGRIRLWGSIGFILSVTALGALFEHLSVRYLPWLLMPLFCGIFLSTLLIGGDAPVPRKGEHAGGLLARIREMPVWAFLVTNILLQVSHGSYYTFFSIHLAQQGYSRLAVGLLWALGVIAEVVLFLVMHRLLHRFSLRHIALAALGLTTLRWCLIAGWSDVLSLLILAQLMHAASYGAMHAMSIQFIHLHFGPTHQARGQALYGGLSFGAGGAIGAWMAGVLVDWHGTSAAFWGSAVAIGLGLIVAYVGLRPRPELAYAN